MDWSAAPVNTSIRIAAARVATDTTKSACRSRTETETSFCLPLPLCCFELMPFLSSASRRTRFAHARSYVRKLRANLIIPHPTLRPDCEQKRGAACAQHLCRKRNFSPDPALTRATPLSGGQSRQHSLATHWESREKNGKWAQGWMIGHRRKGRKPDTAFANARMAVFARTALVQAVVQVDRLQTVQSHRAIERLEHAVKVMHDIVACIPHVTGVKAHPPSGRKAPCAR